VKSSNTSTHKASHQDPLHLCFLSVVPVVHSVFVLSPCFFTRVFLNSLREINENDNPHKHTHGDNRRTPNKKEAIVRRNRQNSIILLDLEKAQHT